MITIWVPKRLVEIDLYNVAAQSPAALAEMSEKSYRQRVAYAAQKIRDSRAKIVMLTGPSASGKTTSAHKVAEALEASGTPAHVISLDNFFKGAQYYPRLPDGTLDYENPDTLDMPLIRQCLSDLSTTGKTVLPIYDFTTESRSSETETLDLKGGVCIVEGIHALNPELTGLVKGDDVYRIYAGLREEYCIDGRRVINTQDIRLCRRTLRDAAARGRSPAKTLAMWDRVLDGETVYQGLQDYGRLFAGHFLHLRAGPHRKAPAPGEPALHAGRQQRGALGRDGPPLRACGPGGAGASARRQYAARVLRR